MKKQGIGNSHPSEQKPLAGDPGRDQGTGPAQRPANLWVPQVRGPHGKVLVRGVEIPRIWGPGKPPNLTRLIGPIIILLAATAAITPQLIRGNSCGHDFDFHLISWLDCLNAWRNGIAYPHWTASANFGAGEPRFVFYPPLTWMLGAALGAVLSWQSVPIVLTFLLLAGTGLATWALARQALTEGPATLAGCLALFSGYALFTAYERSAFAELAGGIWIPLVLLFALSARQRSSAPALIRALDSSAALLGLAVAGAWLSNPTVGVMACYLLAAVALTAAFLSHSWAPVLRAAISSALGMGLVAFYLIPAAWEQRWVDIHQVTQDPGQTLENNWLFTVHADPSLAPHDQVLHAVSIIVVLMIAVAFGSLLVCWLRGRLPGERRWFVPLALIPAAVLFLQFPFSRPIWNLLPELRFLQFPWRWLLVLEAPMAIFFASAVSSSGVWRRIAVWSACIAIFLAMTAYAGSVLFQPCDDEDAVPGMIAVYRSGQGFVGTNEYEPIGADNSLIAAGLPQACFVGNPTLELGKPDDDGTLVWSPDQKSCESTFAAQRESWRIRPDDLHIRATVPHSGYLILRRRSYPAWRVAMNGQLVLNQPRRADGLIAVPVPQGPIDLAVDWATTPDVLAGRWLSGFALIVLACLCLLERRLARLTV